MLKELRATCVVMLLISANLLSMKLENQFLQEQMFHEKLIKHDLIQNGTQSYYKKINPITSNPPTGADQWRIATVSIAGQKICPTINGVYTHGNLSFTIDPTIAFDQTDPLDISIIHGEKIKTQFTNATEKKVPVLPVLASLKDVSNAIHNNKLSLIRYLTLKGTLRISGEKPCVILIEGRNQCAQPITLRGMELVCRKDEKRTKIFFDFVDINNDSIDHLNPIEYEHSKIIADETIVCIKDHRMYTCTGKEIYGFFDPEIRNKWVPDESNFYDQDQHKLLSLPSCYSDLDDHQETLNEQIVWVFGDNYNSFYQLYGTEGLKDSNSYMYSNGGLFFLTLPYKAIYKECFSHNNKKELDYLVQVPKPHVVIRDDVGIEGGKRNWSTGIYEVIRENDRCSWHRIGAPVDDVINFCDNVVRTDTKFPIEPLSARENKQWCDAAQRFFSCFATKIHLCNQELLHGFKTWGNLAKLNLSQVQLENGLRWKDFFISLGGMTQLTSLRFENSNPLSDLFGDYSKLADFASNYYLTLGACLKKLTNLKELHLSGLWLKSHKYLGSGCEGWVSTEVARLSGIINHWRQSGVRSIIQSICALKCLENLSIDGIPHHGCSDFSRQTYGERLLFAPLWVISTPLQIWDGKCQDADLKKLVEDSANQLAQIVPLKNISVYSPGGNCVDFFSKDFREQLIRARRARARLVCAKLEAKLRVQLDAKLVLPIFTVTAKEL